MVSSVQDAGGQRTTTNQYAGRVAAAVWICHVGSDNTTMTNLQGKTRKELVLDLLKSKEWVSTAEICAVNVGGTEGTRRLRELRAAGHVIAQRRKANSSQAEYSLQEEVVGRIPERPFNTSYGHGIGATDGSASRRAALSTPWVAWHGSSNKGWTAKLRGNSLAVRPMWTDESWIWVVTHQNGSQDSGRADSLVSAKQKAIEASR